MQSPYPRVRTRTRDPGRYLTAFSVSILSAYMGRYLTLPRFGREESLLLKVIFFLLDPWRIQTAQYNGSIQVYIIMDVYTCNNNNYRDICFWEWFANNYYTNTITFLSRFWWEGRGKTTICLCDKYTTKAGACSHSIYSIVPENLTTFWMRF